MGAALMDRKRSHSWWVILYDWIYARILCVVDNRTHNYRYGGVQRLFLAFRFRFILCYFQKWRTRKGSHRSAKYISPISAKKIKFSLQIDLLWLLRTEEKFCGPWRNFADRKNHGSGPKTLLNLNLFQKLTRVAPCFAHHLTCWI